MRTGVVFVGVLAAMGSTSTSASAFLQGDEASYLARWRDMEATSHTTPGPAVCSGRGSLASRLREVRLPKGVVRAGDAGIASRCNYNALCVVGAGTVLLLNRNFNVGALRVERGGSVIWVDSAEGWQWLCAGYILVDGGSLDISLRRGGRGMIYIKDNGASVSTSNARYGAFYKRFLGSTGGGTISIRGRKMARTWSLLATTSSKNVTNTTVTMTLMHDAAAMGWQRGDRVVVASMAPLSQGTAMQGNIIELLGNTIIVTSAATMSTSTSVKIALSPSGTVVLQSPEVINLSRSIVITGDDFTHEACDPGLVDASRGCMCDAGIGRSICTVGLHVLYSGSGSGIDKNGKMRIENTRIEKCGQRGIMGKYCLHFHYANVCPGCVFRGNAVEFGQQRGIVVHETHAATVEANVLSDVRGAGIYIEDGNEMYNKIIYNVVICPWSMGSAMHGGCTVPGTDNAQADTALNQAGLWSLTPSNYVVGNRFANSFNGMFYDFGVGRGGAWGKVDTRFSSDMGRLEGNTFHGHGRFGTYILVYSPKWGCVSNISDNGFLGEEAAEWCRDDAVGRSVLLLNNVDYGNAFAGGYNMNDVQIRGHVALENLNNLYWKETANFADGVSAHISGGWYSDGNLALPDMAGFIIENTVFTGLAQLETNHHCNVGVTGFLCMPTYILSNVSWHSTASPWVTWHEEANHWGGIIVEAPSAPASHFFPPGFQSLVSFHWTYLLRMPGCRESWGEWRALYGGGILCSSPLRSLKIYSRGQTRADHVDLLLSVTEAATNRSLANFTIEYHQVGADTSATGKQGYAMPVLADTRFIYSVSGWKGSEVRHWTVVFSEPVFGSRWSEDEMILSLAAGERKRLTSGDTANERKRVQFTHSLPAAYCDCESGFYGARCQNHVCAGIDCGVHGRCVGQYLGGTLAPTRGACACEWGWSGPTCASHPCANITCSGRGFCTARNEREYKCNCGADFSGADCETSCAGFGCASSQAPFGCAWIPTMQTLCLRGSGCYYSDHWIDIHDSSNVCCYGANCDVCDMVDCAVVGAGNDCYTDSYCARGTCAAVAMRADGTVCNGVPWGKCLRGVCVPGKTL